MIRVASRSFTRRARSLSAALLLAPLALLVPTGCSSGGGGGAPATGAPTITAYDVVDALYALGVAIADNTPTTTGAAPTGFAISPALPAGLAFDVDTGVISGTPTAVTAATDFDVVATNAEGDSAPFTISIEVLEAPNNLTYDAVDVSYATGVAITPNNPSFDGTADTFAVAPALPAGLAIDAGTGVISGVPTALTADATYTVTASNAVGQDTVDLLIEIVDTVPAPAGLAYPDATPTYALGLPITPQTPSVTGTVDTFDLDPSSDPLPSGLALDATTGELSGTPATTGVSNVVVRATNAGGSTTGTLDITVEAPAAQALYVANSGSSTIGVYHFDGPTLRHGGFARTDSPRSLLVSPDRAFLFAVNASTESLSVFAIDDADASLTEVAGSPFTPGGGPGLSPQAIAIDADSRFLYVANQTGDSITGWSIDSGTGALTELPGSPFGSFAGAVDLVTSRSGATDVLYVVAKNEATNTVRALRIEASGTLAEIDAEPAVASPDSLAVAPGGDFLFVGGDTNNDLARFAIEADGTLTSLGAVHGMAPVLFGADSMAPAQQGASRFLYVADDQGGVAQMEINGDGSLTNLAPSAVPTVGSASRDVVATPDGANVYVCDLVDREIMTFDAAADGSLTELVGLPLTRTHASPTGMALLPRVGANAFVTTNLYSANRGDSDVNQWSVAGDGSLTPLTPPNVASGTGTNWVTAHPFLERLYTANFGAAFAGLSAFPLNADGSLDAPNLQLTAITNADAFSLDVDPNGENLYAVLFSDNVVVPYPINGDGSLAAAGATAATGALVRGCDIDPTGRFLYAANGGASGSVSQFELNLTSGAISQIAPATVSAGTNTFNVEVHPSGRFLYAANIGSPNQADAGDLISIYSIDANTGALTELGASPVSTAADPVDIVVHPNGRFLFVANQTAGNVQRFLVNISTGNAFEDGSLNGALISTQAVGGSPSGLALSKDGNVLYVAMENNPGLVEAYTIDGNGQLVFLDSEAAGDLVENVAIRGRVE